LVGASHEADPSPVPGLLALTRIFSVEPVTLSMTTPPHTPSGTYCEPANPRGSSKVVAVRIWVAALVLVLVVTAAITIKLLVRRRAPVGGWFSDSSRSAGTLSVIGTMFAVMLAFVILLALQSYQRAREGSSVEAIAVAELNSVGNVFSHP
jgi:hypothetical protein